MSLNRRWRLAAGSLLGLGLAASASAQDLQPGAEPSTVVRPFPPVMPVPPGGIGPVWHPAPIDPVALERHQPGKVAEKASSWKWRRHQGRFWGYPEEFEPRPLGASVYEHGKIMAANAVAARLVLFNYDFVDGTNVLNPRGMDQLAKFSAQLLASPYPLLVERTPENPLLAESRRYAVLAILARGPCPLTSDRVLVGVPTPHGMSGIDAHIIGSNALTRTQNYGPPIPLQSSGVNSPSGVTSGGSTSP